MSMIARLKSLAGGELTAQKVTVPGASGDTVTLYIPDHVNLIALDGPQTMVVGSLLASTSTRNRKVFIYQRDDVDDVGDTTFTNTDGASVAGQMDLGGSDVTLDAADVLVLLLRSDGTWLKLRYTDN